MKKIGFAVIATLVLAMSLTSCVRNMQRDHDGDDKIVTSQRVVRNFDKIVVSTSCDVHYVQGNAPSVRITGPERMLKRIITECNGNTLTIKLTKAGSLMEWYEGDDVDVYVTSPDLIDVTMNGSGDFSADGKVDSDTLNISLFGSGDLNMSDIICDEMTTTLKGSGDIDIQRLECGKSSVFLSGAGDIDIQQFNVAQSNVVLRGVGDISIGFNHCGSAECELYGVGDITLKGDVKSFKKSIMGTGDIDTNEMKVTK
jgi:hypothetical protein